MVYIRPQDIEDLLLDSYEANHELIEVEIPTWLRRHIDPDDILQDTYVAAWQHVAGSRVTKESLLSWLRKVAQNKLRDRIREEKTVKRGAGKRVSNGSRAAVVTNAHGRSPTPSKEFADREMESFVRDSLARLSDRHRRAIQLRFFEKNSFATLASEFGITEVAARMLTRRAVESLHSVIGRRI